MRAGLTLGLLLQQPNQGGSGVVVHSGERAKARHYKSDSSPIRLQRRGGGGEAAAVRRPGRGWPCGAALQLAEWS